MGFHVIKENDLFFVSDEQGTVPAPTDNPYGYGLYTKDTRMLSELGCTFEPAIFQTLSADSSANYSAEYHYTNRELAEEGQVQIARESLLLQRRQMVDGETFYELGLIRNYGRKPAIITVQYQVSTDFLDMFEVRAGQTYDHPGDVQPRDVHWSVLPTGIRYEYESRDSMLARTDVSARVLAGDGHPSQRFIVCVTDVAKPHVGHLTARLSIAPGETVRWQLTIAPSIRSHTKQKLDLDLSGSEPDICQWDTVASKLHARYQAWSQGLPRLHVEGDESFLAWYERGMSDIRMLCTDIGHGMFPVAGVPWYAVPFGRDSLLTALQCLPIRTELAVGTLRTMAAYQGKHFNPVRDEQPGKIMHELRSGELTRLGDVPFGPYYGSVDATPLYLILAAETFKWTTDKALLQELLPTVYAAFDWIERYGDVDGDGFIEYHRQADGGIANQGWKDSGDSIVHQDGTLAVGPIALCEVQGYVYRAYQEWSAICSLFGETAKAKRLKRSASKLQAQFLNAFYTSDHHTIALALDGQKRPVQTVTSNMGQVLWSGILPPEVAKLVAERLLQPDLFNGFGIRTMSSLEAAYNPLSYHNGSVWPHDNSVILQGFVQYGFTDQAIRLLSGLMKAQNGFALARLPELFAGLADTEVDKPVPYPVSCSPQAWAAGTPILALVSLLGIELELNGQLTVRPWLPERLDLLRIDGISIGTGKLDITLRRTPTGSVQTEIGTNTTGLGAVIVAPPKGVSATANTCIPQ